MVIQSQKSGFLLMEICVGLLVFATIWCVLIVWTGQIIRLHQASCERLEFVDRCQSNNFTRHYQVKRTRFESEHIQQGNKNQLIIEIISMESNYSSIKNKLYSRRLIEKKA